MIPFYPPNDAPRGLYITINNLLIINLIRHGKSTKEIAEIMTISDSTVRDQLNSIYKKLGIHSREELENQIKELNLEPLEDIGALLHTNGRYELKSINKNF